MPASTACPPATTTQPSPCWPAGTTALPRWARLFIPSCVLRPCPPCTRHQRRRGHAAGSARRLFVRDDALQVFTGNVLLLRQPAAGQRIQRATSSASGPASSADGRAIPRRDGGRPGRCSSRAAGARSHCAWRRPRRAAFVDPRIPVVRPCALGIPTTRALCVTACPRSGSARSWRASP